MIESTFNLCLLHIIDNQTAFETVEMQTNDTLMLANDQFADLKENELQKVNLTFKNREKLIDINLIKFNDEMINKNDKNLLLNQLKQFDQIKLINLSFSVDLIQFKKSNQKIDDF